MKRPLIQQLILLAFFLLAYTSAFSQEYFYDNNGSLTRDENKGITYSHYNHLNLVDTIIYEDGHKVVYTYTAAGQKLKEQVLAANGSPVTTRDYFGNLLYLNNTLQEIQYEDGRAVPMLPGNDAGPLEYQYHLTDQLGSVRATITSENAPVHYTATMESEQSAEEENLFEGLSSHRVTHGPANHTPGGNEAARLMSGTADGVSLTLAVMNGDKLKLSVYAYYEGSSIDGEPAGSRNVMNTLWPVVESVLSGGALVPVEGLGAPGGNGNLNGLPGGVSTNSGNVPAAHLNYQLLDKNRQFVNGGFVAVTENASFAHELLAINEVRVTQSGYLHVYLSNALTSSHEVYFDDLKIEHTKSIEVQSDDYDPFGMTLPEQHDERVGGVINRHLFSGKERQDLDSSSYDFGARMYDAALGRWGAVDPLAEKYAGWSPYNYVMNNPIKLVDPNGREAIISPYIYNRNFSNHLIYGSFNERFSDDEKPISSMDYSGNIRFSGEDENGFRAMERLRLYPALTLGVSPVSNFIMSYYNMPIRLKDGSFFHDNNKINNHVQEIVTDSRYKVYVDQYQHKTDEGISRHGQYGFVIRWAPMDDFQKRNLRLNAMAETIVKLSKTKWSHRKNYSESYQLILNGDHYSMKKEIETKKKLKK
jgi:RHS repeat-associated protein